MSSQRKLVFYGAISVDRYIVREDHSLDWLIETEGEKETSRISTKRLIPF
ncbi:hypothetical protein [Domibacillus iocasae]|nr:hypothetical protein [Domibacillus iocasae]